MRTVNFFVVAALATTLAANSYAQQEKAEPDAQRSARQEQLNLESEMRDAEARLEEAARRIAELSSRQLPMPGGQQWAFRFGDRPMLGITIDGENNEGPVEGVAIRGVTPGGSAFEAGLRSGDTITAINKESMSASSSAEANAKLMAFMAGVEDGDTLDIDYLRDGKVTTVAVTPKVNTEHHFAFGSAGHAPMAPSAPMAPMPRIAPGAMANVDVFRWRGHMGWRDMELTPLSEDLGKYFGTDKGLLVVRAPAGGELQLKDGDVIQTIGGREPASISHAIRILASYQPGEKIRMEIMRDKRRKTLDVELPDNRQSKIGPDGDPVVIEVRRHLRVD